MGCEGDRYASFNSVLTQIIRKILIRIYRVRQIIFIKGEHNVNRGWIGKKMRFEIA